MYFSADELKIAKLVIESPELRSQFISLDLFRFLSKITSDILRKVFDIMYFKTAPIDLEYVRLNSSALGIDSLIFMEFKTELSHIVSDPLEFWVCVDNLKTKNIKSSIIPVIITEYEKLTSANNELIASASLANIREAIHSILGKSVIHVHDEDDVRNISDRLRLYSGEEESSQRRFLTGYDVMDSHFGGFASSELSIFMGASGIGKTTLLVNLAHALWDTGKANVHMYSLEMPIVQVMRRFDARIFQVDSNLLRSGGYKTPNLEIVDRIKSRTNSLKVFDFPPQSTVQDIEANILKADVKPDIVIVDYIGLLRAKMKREAQLWEINDEVGLTMKYLAKRYHIHVMTASQVTTEASKKADDSQEGYQLSDAAGGKSIGHHADIVCGIKVNENLNIMEFFSPKFRDGSKFSFQMFVDRARCYLYEIK